MKQKSYILANGQHIPALGFGTFLIPDGDEAKNSTASALKTGYRHVDTASIYNNEKGVGEGILESGVPREKIFLSSKVWNSEQGYEGTLTAFEQSLKRLQTDYLDLYLIHWHMPESAETWKAMEKLYIERRVKAIGVCNFTARQLDNLAETASITPMVNQVELHPQFPQNDLQTYCRAKHIQMEAWAPLIQGKIFDIPLFQKIADSYKCTVAQLAVAWQFQQGNVALVKSTKPERIKSNFAIPDITITPADMEKIASLAGERIGRDPENHGLI